MMTIRILFLVGAFGAFGAVSRYGLSELCQRWLGTGFPYGTLTVNVLGCFLLGALAQLGLSAQFMPEAWRVGLGVGFLGGLTTFSTFGHETFRHLEHGNWLVAAGNVTANLILGLMAVWGGVAVARMSVGGG